MGVWNQVVNDSAESAAGRQPDGAKTGRDWTGVYERNAPRLTRLATLLVGPDDAHDLVIDSVLRAVTSRSWERVEAHAAYLSRVMVNLANDRHRRNEHRRRREIAWFRDATARASSLRSPADVEQLNALVPAIAALSPTQRAIVFLHYWEDLPLAQVAEHLGTTRGTVHRQFDRAKRRLRSVLDAAEEEPDE